MPKLHPRAIVTLARKDLWDAISNLRLLVLIVMPVGFSLFYSALFSSAGDLQQQTMALYDPGDSGFAPLLETTYNVTVQRVNSAEALQAALADANRLVGVALPPDFEAQIRAGQTPELQVTYKAPPDFLPRLKAEAQTTLTSALREYAGQEPPVQVSFAVLEEQQGGGPVFDISQYLLLLFIMMNLTMTGVMISPSLLIEEKEKHTLKALNVMPLNHLDIVVAKGLVGLVYTLLGALVILALNQGLGGQVWLTVAVVFLSALVVVLIGLCVGAFFRDVNAMNTWGSAVMLPLLLPGMLVPIMGMGLLDLGIVGTVLRVFPTYYTTDALIQTYNGTATLNSLALDLAVIGGFVVLFAALASYLLRPRT